MASDAADALAKTYARNKKLLSLRSFHHKWFTADWIAGRLHTPRFGALRSAAERAAVGLTSPMVSGSSRRDDQKPGNVIANDHFASPTDLEITSAFGRFCCKIRFTQGVKNSPGYRRGFRVKMRGTS
jgi:hypothetical protein